VAADAPRANWFVRLSDVSPDGTVTQVAGAGFNGTHRNSARDPEDILPGEKIALDIEMHFTSWVFPRGHQIRVSISNAQWPMFWPTPHLMTSHLFLGGKDGSHLLLPVVPRGDASEPIFLKPAENPRLEGFENIDTGNASGYGEISSVDRNPQTGEVTITATNTGASRYPWGIESYLETIEHRTSDANPERTAVVGSHRLEVTLDKRILLWEGELDFSSDAENFFYRYTRKVSENGTLLRQKTWRETIARDFQ